MALGKPLTIDWVNKKDYLDGDLKTTLRPVIEHPAMAALTREQYDEAIKYTLIGLLVCLTRGAWSVSDEWNKLLPDYKFTSVEEFLQSVWGI